MAKRIRKPLEKNVHQQVCDYLSLQYPNVIFYSDASGMRVGMGLRMELKRKRCKKYNILDLIIDHPAGQYHGMRLEIKRSRDEVYRRDGRLRDDPHVHDQWETITQYRNIGYFADFGCGFDHCKALIDDYMNLI